MEITTLKTLEEKINKSDDLKKELQQNPEEFFKKYFVEPDPIRNIVVFKTIIWFIGLTIILCLSAATLITLWPPVKTGKDTFLLLQIPDFFKMIASAAVGAITGLLVPTPAAGGK